jgi:hypothetical protein
MCVLVVLYKVLCSFTVHRSSVVLVICTLDGFGG